MHTQASQHLPWAAPRRRIPVAGCGQSSRRVRHFTRGRQGRAQSHPGDNLHERIDEVRHPSAQGSVPRGLPRIRYLLATRSHSNASFARGRHTSYPSLSSCDRISHHAATAVSNPGMLLYAGADTLCSVFLLLRVPSSPKSLFICGRSESYNLSRICLTAVFYNLDTTTPLGPAQLPGFIYILD